MPLINPTEPDIIMLITMKLVTSQSEQTGHECTVFTNDQQLFKRATQITLRIKPEEWEDFFPILGGMHTLYFLDVFKLQ